MTERLKVVTGHLKRKVVFTNRSSKDIYKAAVCVELGKPLEIRTFPAIDPNDLGSTELLVRVHACGVNYADILMCKGQYQQKMPTPFTPGVELAGEIIATGEDVQKFRKGDRVIAVPSVPSGCAQQCICDEEFTWRLPDSVSFEVGAAFLASYGTAYLALNRTAQLKKTGETVLVTGAAGSTGMAAVDLAANVFGAKVIGACGGKVKGDFVQKMGAKYAIDYLTEDVRKCVNKYTDGKGAEVVFDTVGGDNFLSCLKSLAVEGRILTIGYTSGKIPSIPANLLLVKSCSAMGVVWGDYKVKNPPVFKDSIEQCLHFLQKSMIKPYVGAVYPLSQINEAFKNVLSRKTFGKVVICTRG